MRIDPQDSQRLIPCTLTLQFAVMDSTTVQLWEGIEDEAPDIQIERERCRLTAGHQLPHVFKHRGKVWSIPVRSIIQ